MSSRRSVGVAAGVSGVLIASSAAFAVANGIFAGPAHSAGRVGSFEAVTHELVPAPLPRTPAAGSRPPSVAAGGGPDDPTTWAATGAAPPAAGTPIIGADAPSPTTSPEHEGTAARKAPPTTVSTASTVPETDPTAKSGDPPVDDNGHSGDD